MEEVRLDSPQSCEPVVFVRNAHKSYGGGKNTVVVLDGLDMTVPKGCIYSLLGASGCGKTTLLGCILGNKRLNSGQIWVLGGKPTSKSSDVPGPAVGYMPQETFMHGEFTIYETIKYYGWIAGMNTKKIQERFEFLQKLLMLPDGDQSVKTLSGGQQRRVSLASALIAKPKLLILDEPTVGLDPIVREAIWSHLLDISKNSNTTIIITTHYIEEARQAQTVGLMRGGCLLAEESPESLIRKHGAQTLEEVFLKLSIVQNSKSDQKATNETGVDNSLFLADNQIYDQSRLDDIQTIRSSEIVPPEREYVAKCTDYLPCLRANHVLPIIWRVFLWVWRNKSWMTFTICLPIILATLVCVCIGHNPTDLNIAIVNYETNNDENCDGTLSCNATQLSCSYLGYLQRQALTLRYFNSEEEARLSVLKGKTYASVVLRHNYSAALRSRLDEGKDTELWNLAFSEIDVFRDVHNKQISTYLHAHLYSSIQNFIGDFIEMCGSQRRALMIPVEWQPPVYGTNDPNFADFVLPGLLLIIVFYQSVITAAFDILSERSEGNLEKIFVTGITEIELLLAHMVYQFTFTIIQSIIVLVFVFCVFNSTLNGSLALVIALTLLTGFCGMCFGLFTASVADNERNATYLSLGSFFPMILMGGIAWPVEAMHYILAPFTIVFPLTRPTESLRSILQRGWGLSAEIVYTGFITISVWALIFLTISILFLKFKKS